MKNSIVLFLIGFFMYSCGTKDLKQKVVFIDTVKVFESFEMKKDYDRKLEQDLQLESAKVQEIIDQLKTLKNEGDNSQIEALRNELNNAQLVFDQKFQALSQQYTTEVNDRLNNYIESFGKANDYDIVLGSTGQGNIMFVKEDINVTSEIIKYINREYSK